MPAVVGVAQFPKRDFNAGWLAFGAVLTELVAVVPARVLVMLEKMDGATVVLLMGPKMEEVMLGERAEAGFAAVTVGTWKPAPAVAPPKMGLNVCAEGLTSGGAAVGAAAGATAKMGLNPEANRGLLLAEATAEAGLEEDAGAALWPVGPKSPELPGGGVALDAAETGPGSRGKAGARETPGEED